MNRRLVALCALALPGCYADYVTPDGSASAYFSIPVGAPAPVQVGMAPPPPRYESPLSCGYGQLWVPGQWDWNGNWYWQSGFCTTSQAGYSYVPPQYSGGYYVRGHWGRPGAYQPQPGYVPPPAPAYNNRGSYVPPPPPAYNGGGYAPPPAYNGGGYAPPPQPNYAAPPPRPNYVPPPPPAQPSYAAPPPPPPARYVPPPAPAYNNRDNYVPPPPPGR